MKKILFCLGVLASSVNASANDELVSHLAMDAMVKSYTDLQLDAQCDVEVSSEGSKLIVDKKCIENVNALRTVLVESGRIMQIFMVDGFMNSHDIPRINIPTVNLDIEVVEFQHYPVTLKIKKGCDFYGYKRNDKGTLFQAKCSGKTMDLKLSNDQLNINSFNIVSDVEMSATMKISGGRGGIDFSKLLVTNNE